MRRLRPGFVRRFAILTLLGMAAAILVVASSTYAVMPSKLLPPGLRPTEVNVYPTLDRALLGPQLAVNPTDPDNPTVTFGAFDASGRPQVLYIMLWGLPRLDA